jgi:hypothetical protein
MKRSLFGFGLALAIVGVTLLSLPTPAQAPNPVLGTWKQNMEKSVYNPGPPPPMGLGAVRQYAAGADGSIVAVTFNLDAAGLPSLGAISAANYDGKEYPQYTIATLATSLGSHLAPRIERTIAYTATNPYTVEIVQRQDGKVVARSTRTIARDGKTMTDKSDYVDDSQRHVLNVLVFEKQ